MVAVAQLVERQVVDLDTRDRNPTATRRLNACVCKWSKHVDCNSIAFGLRRFESVPHAPAIAE